MFDGIVNESNFVRVDALATPSVTRMAELLAEFREVNPDGAKELNELISEYGRNQVVYVDSSRR